MRTLTLSKESFIELLPKLIASGVLFKSLEKEGEIYIEFTGGY